MSTLSFHVDAELEERIRRAAAIRRVAVSRFLKETVARSLDESTGQGRDLRGMVRGTGDLVAEEPALPPWNEKDPFLQ